MDPTKRNQMMQTWGREEQDSLTKRWTRRATKRMNLHEGMGVDHQEWMRQKNQAKQARMEDSGGSRV